MDKQTRTRQVDGTTNDDTRGHAGFLVGVAAGLVANYVYDNHIKQVPLLDGVRDKTGSSKTS